MMIIPNDNVAVSYLQVIETKVHLRGRVEDKRSYHGQII